jgi:hypothetical protein
MKEEKPAVLLRDVSWIIQIDERTRMEVRTSTAPSRTLRLSRIDGMSVVRSAVELLGIKSRVAVKRYTFDRTWTRKTTT